VKSIEGKRILVTGAAGTIGQELIRQLLEESEYKPAEVVGIDSNESELFFLDQRFSKHKDAYFYLADIRDENACIHHMEKIDIVFHTAALKHVILCEKSPMQAIQTNIMGIENLINAAKYHQVEKFIFTSSDKAVNPTNVMGTSKLMGERLVTAANSSQKHDHTIFASTRFGNVLGSNGSVIPIFKKQIQAGGPITLTDQRMTRFVMSIEEAVKLVIDSADLACGGEVFITKMPVIRIKDLAEVMIQELAAEYGQDPKAIEVNIIGSKPGEKLYEELMSDEETSRAVELKEYFSVLPAFRGVYKDIYYAYQDKVTETVTNPYVSADEPCLTQDELKEFLYSNNLI
jgi:FlaA1/EpsC-like NDP-sugar epimerase